MRHRSSGNLSATLGGDLVKALVVEDRFAEAKDWVEVAAAMGGDDPSVKAETRARQLRRARAHVEKLAKTLRKKRRAEAKAAANGAPQEASVVLAGAGAAPPAAEAAGVAAGAAAQPPQQPPSNFSKAKLQANCIAILELQRANAELLASIEKEEAEKAAAAKIAAQRDAEIAAAAALEAVSAAAALETAAQRGVRVPRSPDPILTSIIDSIDGLKELIPTEARGLARAARKDVGAADAEALAAAVAADLQRRHDAILASDGDEVITQLAAEARAIAAALASIGMLQPLTKSAIPEWRKGQRKPSARPPSPPGPQVESLGEARFRLARALDDSRRVKDTARAADPLQALIASSAARRTMDALGGAVGGRTRGRDRFVRAHQRAPPSAASTATKAAAAAPRLKASTAVLPFDASAFRTVGGAARQRAKAAAAKAAEEAGTSAQAPPQVDLKAVANLLDEAALAAPRSRIATVTAANAQISALRQSLRYHPLAAPLRPGQVDPTRLRWSSSNNSSGGRGGSSSGAASDAEVAVQRQYQRLAKRLGGRRTDAVAAIARLGALATRVHLECRITAALVWCSDEMERCAESMRGEYARAELSHSPLDPLIGQLLRPSATWSTRNVAIATPKSGASGLQPVASLLYAAVAERAPGRRWTMVRQAASDTSFVEAAVAAAAGAVREGDIDSTLPALQRTLHGLRVRIVDAAILAEKSCRFVAESSYEAKAAVLDLAALEKLRDEVEAHARAEARRYIVQREMKLNKAKVIAAKMRYIRESTGAFTERAAAMAIEKRARDDAASTAEALQMSEASARGAGGARLDKARFFRLALEREQADRARTAALAADPLGGIASINRRSTAQPRALNARSQLDARWKPEGVARDPAPAAAGSSEASALDNLSSLTSRFAPWAEGPKAKALRLQLEEVQKLVEQGTVKPEVYEQLLAAQNGQARTSRFAPWAEGAKALTEGAKALTEGPKAKALRLQLEEVRQLVEQGMVKPEVYEQLLAAQNGQARFVATWDDVIEGTGPRNAVSKATNGVFGEGRHRAQVKDHLRRMSDAGDASLQALTGGNFGQGRHRAELKEHLNEQLSRLGGKEVRSERVSAAAPSASEAKMKEHLRRISGAGNDSLKALTGGKFGHGRHRAELKEKLRRLSSTGEEASDWVSAKSVRSNAELLASIEKEEAEAVAAGSGTRVKSRAELLKEAEAAAASSTTADL